MDRPLILYLHGFCSSPASLKSRQLGEYMSGRGLGDRFVCPLLSPVPDAAVATASRLIEGADGPVTLVGSSLGGHYANHLAEKRFTFTAAHAAQLEAQVSKPTPSRYWLLSEAGDEVLNWRQAAAFYAGCRQTVLPGGDHSFTRFPDFMPQILEFAGL